MNAGLREVDADAVAMLQADTFVEPGYRAACVRALEDPEVGSVAPKLLRTTGATEPERLALIDAAAMSVDRRRKNSLVGHGRSASAYGVAARGVRRRRSGGDVPARGARRLRGARGGIRREHARLGLRRRPRLAPAAARVALALRAGRRRPPHPHVQPDDAGADERARPPHPVPQPLPDDRQERRAGETSCATRCRCSSTRCWRSATRCSASPSCSAATARRPGACPRRCAAGG